MPTAAQVESRCLYLCDAVWQATLLGMYEPAVEDDEEGHQSWDGAANRGSPFCSCATGKVMAHEVLKHSKELPVFLDKTRLHLWRFPKVGVPPNHRL